MIDFHPHDAPCYRCTATAWECIGQFTPHRGRTQDVVECAFCGVRVRVEAAAVPVPVSVPTPAHGTEFRFQFGRFKGLTFAEADGEPNGRKYLEVMRSNPKLKDRIEEYLKHAAPSA